MARKVSSNEWIAEWPQLRVSGVRKFSVGGDFVAQHSLCSKSQLIFCGLAINQKFRATRICSRHFRTSAVALFAYDEKQTEICGSGIEKFFRGGDHCGDDAFGVAGTAPPK